MKIITKFNFQIINDHILVANLIFPEICSKAQINVGDRITSIGGISIPKIIKEKEELLSTSNREKLVYLLSKYENNLIWNDTRSASEWYSMSLQNISAIFDDWSANVRCRRRSCESKSTGRIPFRVYRKRNFLSR